MISSIGFSLIWCLAGDWLIRGMYAPVETRKQGAITVVTLDRADVRNAVDPDTAGLLYDALVAFDADADARVAVFHGANGYFCAGWDLQAGARLTQLLRPWLVEWSCAICA